MEVDYMALQLKSDYSFLFNSVQSSGSQTSSLNSLLSGSLLSDYASIKNGSYGKLMKAYYTDSSDTSTSSWSKQSVSTSKDSAKTLSSIQSSTDSLKDAADALLSKDSDSVFSKGDTEKIYSAVSAFVKQYNSTIQSLENVKTSSIQNRVDSLTNLPIANSKLLKSVGITIQNDNTLALDENTFKSANANTVKSLFHSTGSFAYQVSAQASLINYSAAREASKSNTYTDSAVYNNTYNSGNLFNYYL